MTYFNIHFTFSIAMRRNAISAMLLGALGAFSAVCSLGLPQADSGSKLRYAQLNESVEIHLGAFEKGRPKKKLPFGNLRKLVLKGENERYALNSVDLPRITSDFFKMSTADEDCQVRITFLQTVLLSKSRPVSVTHKDLIANWEQRIPLVAHIMKEQDSLGSMKPIVYDLIEAKDRQNLKLQEELVLLWSADPVDDRKIGETRLLPPTPFHNQIIDVQYRGIKEPGRRLVGKIMLQILYLREQGRPAILGALLIISKPNGEYQFYSVPRTLLDQIVISEK
jgi:hypothetical protein